MEKFFEVIENTKNLLLEKDWAELRPKHCLLRPSENFRFALYPSNDDSNFYKKCSFASKKLGLLKKLPISKVESLSKSNFRNKSCIQNSTYKKPINLQL